MQDIITQIRTRLRDGEATPEDLTWAQRRIRVLQEWPDDLSRAQSEELEWLASIVSEDA